MPSTLIFAALNGDMTPCQYRLPPDEVIKLEGQFNDEECMPRSNANTPFIWPKPIIPIPRILTSFFRLNLRILYQLAVIFHAFMAGFAFFIPFRMVALD
jgi:hypothetical protein